ncbi:hypothetical protein V1523DRAFT_400006, partial [Lipomyces doorenjongii]
IDTDDDNNFTEDFYCVGFDETNGSAPDPLRNALSSLHYFEAAGAHLSRTYCGDSKRTQERFRVSKAETHKKISQVSNGKDNADCNGLVEAIDAIENSIADATLNNEPGNLKRGGRLSHEEYTTIIDKATVYLSDESLTEYGKAQVRAIVAYFQGLRAGRTKYEISTTISGITFLRGPYIARHYLNPDEILKSSPFWPTRMLPPIVKNSSDQSHLLRDLSIV